MECNSDGINSIHSELNSHRPSLCPRRGVVGVSKSTSVRKEGEKSGSVRKWLREGSDYVVAGRSVLIIPLIYFSKSIRFFDFSQKLILFQEHKA